MSRGYVKLFYLTAMISVFCILQFKLFFCQQKLVDKYEKDCILF